MTSPSGAGVLATMLAVAGTVCAGLTWGWLGASVTTHLAAIAIWSAALALESALLAGAPAALVVLVACAAGWTARARWQQRLARGVM